MLIIGESKLNAMDDTIDFRHNLYELIRRDRVGRDGGGLLIYVKLNYKPSNVIIDKISEMVSFELTSDKQKIGIVACYRPPYDNNVNEFFKSLNCQLQNLEIKKLTKTLIIGDLNLNMNDSIDSRKLVDFNLNHVTISPNYQKSN